jgi:methionine aminopeptidase
MNISNEEKLMYKVMKAKYDSGIPVSFKGSLVLKAFLLESGYTKDTRHTVDIDANWNGKTTPTMEQITESLQKALDKAKINLDVTYFRTIGLLDLN